MSDEECYLCGKSFGVLDDHGDSKATCEHCGTVVCGTCLREVVLPKNESRCPKCNKKQK